MIIRRKRPWFKLIRPKNSFRRNITTKSELFNKKIPRSNLSKHKEEIIMIQPKTICEVESIKEFSNILKHYYPYYAQYYHNATAGERTEYGNEYVTIAYGNSMAELIVLCESKGFVPSERIFDGGYRVQANPEYNKDMTPDDMTKLINKILSSIFRKEQ